jgi:hypothetical protein
MYMMKQREKNRTPKKKTDSFVSAPRRAPRAGPPTLAPLSKKKTPTNHIALAAAMAPLAAIAIAASDAFGK